MVTPSFKRAMIGVWPSPTSKRNESQEQGSVEMNNNILSHLISLGLFLAGMTLLVGCRLGEVERATASNITASAENSNKGIDPADR